MNLALRRGCPPVWACLMASTKLEGITFGLGLASELDTILKVRRSSRPSSSWRLALVRKEHRGSVDRRKSVWMVILEGCEAALDTLRI